MRRRLGLLLAATCLAGGGAIAAAGPAAAAAGGCTIESGCPGAVHKFSGWGIGQHNGWTGDTPGRNVGG
jgi:hypothetical protein